MFTACDNSNLYQVFGRTDSSNIFAIEKLFLDPLLDLCYLLRTVPLLPAVPRSKRFTNLFVLNFMRDYPPVHNCRGV